MPADHPQPQSPLSLPQKLQAQQLPAPPHDITGLKPEPFPLELVFWGLCGIAILIGLLRIWQRYRQKKPIQGQPLTPKSLELEQEWLQQLQALEVPLPFHASHREAYYFNLSMILRQLIEFKSHIPVTDLTTAEITVKLKDSLHSLNLTAQRWQECLDFFAKADNIKFAHFESGITEAEQDKKLVESLFREIMGRMIG